MDADHDIDDEVDAAYRIKYPRYAAVIIGHIVSPEARPPTIKLVPRSRPAWGLDEWPLAGWVGPRPAGGPPPVGAVSDCARLSDRHLTSCFFLTFALLKKASSRVASVKMAFLRLAFFRMALLRSAPLMSL